MADIEHKHGEMNIDTQEAGFDGFVSFLTKSIIVCLAVLVILVLFFQ